MTEKSCNEIQPSLSLWLDGELDAENIEITRSHVRHCLACSHELQRLRRLKGAVLRSSKREVMPQELRTKLESGIRAQAEPSPWIQRAGVALAAMLAWAIIVPSSSEPSRDTMSMTKWHASNVPLDISTPDFDAVRRYLSEKVSFAVRKPEFRAKESLSLVGGRVTDLGAQRGALLKFRSSSGESLSVFVSPVKKAAFWERIPAMERPLRRSLEFSTQGGFSVARWSDGVLEYSAVSDAPVKQLGTWLRDDALVD